MPNPVELPNSLISSAGPMQAQAQHPNFSHPRLGHRRSYSTVLPFQYTKESSIRSPPNGRRHVETQSDADHTHTGPGHEQECLVLQTKDDGMATYPQKKKKKKRTEEQLWGEEDVRDAFQRWVLSDKARKRLKQPYFAIADPESLFLPAPPQSVHRTVREKGPIYERVNGVVMNAKPAKLGPYGAEQTIPEIEAQDVRDIPQRFTVRTPAFAEMEDGRGTSSSSSTAPSTDGSGASLELWSKGSGSSSTASTDDSSLQPYQHASKQHVPVTADGHDLGQYLTGSQGSSQQPMPRDAISSGISELSGQRLSLSQQPPASRMTAQKLPLDVISEEDQDIIASSQASDAAPAPIVAGLRDEEDVKESTPKVPAILKQGIVAALDLKPRRVMSRAHDTSPPRVLAAAGIGGDRHVYVLEANPSAEASTPTGSSNPGEIRHHVPKGPGLLDKVEHGIPKAAHALHDKVKKNVTFNPVNDVRFMTPSPNPSMDTIRAVEVDTRHEARS